MSSAATSTRWGRAAALDAAGEATVAVRRTRAAQLDAVHAVVASGRWHIHGFRSPHAWLTTTTGEAPGAVRTTLHLADRIQRMPIVKERFADGILAESALRLLADAWSDDIADAFARDEELLTGWATTLTRRDFTMVMQTWRLHVDPDGAERSAHEQFESRSLHLSELLDGMGRLDGVLDPEGFRIVQEAIRALARRADGDERTATQRRADALVATTRGGTLDTNAGRTTLSAQAVRRMACDAGIHRLITRPDGTILDYGRQTRTVSDSQFDVLALRDHGCRIHGCPIPPGGCDAHHGIHWVDDGNTDLDDLVLVCWYHHHWLHEQHWRIQPLGAGYFALIDPDGNHHRLTPPQIGLTLPFRPPG